MKKLLSVVLALCMMLAVALAEEVPALKWEDYVPVLEEYNLTGQFYTFEQIAVMLWIPEGMEPVELTEEDAEAGYIGYFAPEDESAAVSIVYVDVDGMSLEEYAQQLSEAGAEGIEMGTVNGFPCVSYDLPEQDTSSIAFTTEAGYILEVTCYPVSVENAKVIWGGVVTSIQAAE